MKHIRRFKTENDFLLAQPDIAKPYVCLSNAEKKLHYSCELDKEDIEDDTIQVVYKTNINDYPDEVDYTDFFYYDGTFEKDGVTYYKWRYTNYERWMLTDTNDFSDVSLDNPYTPVGFMYNDEEIDNYYEDDVIVDSATLTFVTRDTSSVNANNHEYVDLGLPSGTLWATRNVGANSATEYGKYFQWGDTEGYYGNEEHDFSWKSYKWCNGNYNSLTKYNNNSSFGSVDNKLVLDPEDDAVHVHMGGDWRMPTQAQLNELNAFTNQKWVTNYQGTGINGRLYTSKKDTSKSIFIPASGYRWDSSVRNQGSNARLWGSTLYAVDPYAAWGLYFVSVNYGIDSGYDRCGGFCVRGVL